MQSSSSLNEQHIWGGNQFTPQSGGTDNTRREDATVVGHGHRTTRFSELPQGGIVASASDDLFHPTSNVPSSDTFSLPNVQTSLSIQILAIIYINAMVYLPILCLILLIIILLSRFHLCLLVIYRLPLHLSLPIIHLIGWVHHHRSLLILIFLISIYLITVRNPHIPLLLLITEFIPRPSHFHPHITLIKEILFCMAFLLLLFLRLLPLFILFQRLYLQ